MSIAGQVPLSQNRAGGAAGVYGDFAQTQPYESVESGSKAHQDVSPVNYLSSSEPDKAVDEQSPVVVESAGGGFSATQDVQDQATQPAEPLEDAPVGKTLNQASPGSSGMRLFLNQISGEQFGQQMEPQQWRFSDSTNTGQSPENHARGSRLHLPTSSPSTSHPTTASAVRQKSRLAMVTNSADRLPASFQHISARQPFVAEAAGEGDGWNDDEVVWGKLASDGSGLAFCGTKAEITAQEAVQELQAAVPGYLEEDLREFSASIAAYPQYKGLDQVCPHCKHCIHKPGKLLHFYSGGHKCEKEI